MAFLKVCIPSCSDGFERMDHAMETRTSLAQPPHKPYRHSPLASYLLYLRTGTGACPYTQIVFCVLN